MTRTKSGAVTALMFGMLGAILYGLWRLYPLAFTILAGTLALIGYACAALLFYCWIGGGRKREAMLPPVARERGTPRAADHVEPVEDWTPSEAWVGDYDAIKREVKEEETV